MHLLYVVQWPTTVIVDRGTEFLAKVGEMIQKDFSLTKKDITMQNLQPNSIIEQVHQTIRNMIQSYVELHSNAAHVPLEMCNFSFFWVCGPVEPPS